MAITLDSISLPDDLIWTDEYDWQGVEQSQSRSLGGRLFVQSRTVTKGRPLTLTGYVDAAWVYRSILDALSALAGENITMTLTLNDGSTYQVLFRYQDQAIEAAAVIDYNDPDAADFYTLVVKLVIV